MWNRSGLPLVFPLVIQTPPGHDYHVLLSEAETDKPVLAAYRTGGVYFRVLVPPGRFHVQIARGTDWLDGERLFGAKTEYFQTPEPLTFKVTGMDRKDGHLIDLRDKAPGLLARADVGPVAICRGLRLDEVMPNDPLDAPVDVLSTPGGTLSFDVRAMQCL